MRILMDLQSCQSINPQQEINQFVLKLAVAIVRLASLDEVMIVLNGDLPNKLNEIKSLFNQWLPEENIVMFRSLGFCDNYKIEHITQIHTYELLTEYFYQQFKPDIVYLPHLFLGFDDRSFAPINCIDQSLISLNIYDTFPWPSQCHALPLLERMWCFRKFYLLKNSNMIFASSERVKNKCIRELNLSADQIVNIGVSEAENSSLYMNTEQQIEQAANQILQTFKLQKNKIGRAKPSVKLKLAYVSQFSTHKTNEYNTLLMSELSKYYRVELITDQAIMTDPYIAANYSMHDSSWFKENADQFDRIMYVIEDVSYENHLLELLSLHPGIVILQHLYFQNFMYQLLQTTPELFYKILYRNHGYCALNDFKNNADEDSFIKYPCFREFIRHSFGVLVYEQGIFDALKKHTDKDVFLLNSGHDFSKECHDYIELRYQNSLSKLKCQYIKKILAINTETHQKEMLINHVFPLIDREKTFKDKQIFIDVSTIIQSDSKTGIHRVVRSILNYFLKKNIAGYRIEPVYFDDNGHYRYARKYTFQLFDLPYSDNDEIIEFQDNEIILFLDIFLNDSYIKNLSEMIRAKKIKTYFIVYDLLPIQYPQWFPEFLAKQFSHWFRFITHFATGVIAISKTVANDIRTIKKSYFNDRVTPLGIGYFHLGADIENSVPSSGLVGQFDQIIKIFSVRPTFLLVTCIAPRKGHEQTFKAFEQLWSENIDINLVFIGRVAFSHTFENFTEKMKTHPELNSRFFWLEHATDDMLLKAYQHATAFIAASEGEGFGIPLIEAAKFKLPIIARDIPIFREIINEHAFYFNGTSPQSLATAVKDWLILNHQGKVPGSQYVRWQTWAQSAEQLLDVVLKENWLYPLS